MKTFIAFGTADHVMRGNRFSRGLMYFSQGTDVVVRAALNHQLYSQRFQHTADINNVLDGIFICGKPVSKVLFLLLFR